MECFTIHTCSFTYRKTIDRQAVRDYQRQPFSGRKRGQRKFLEQRSASTRGSHRCKATSYAGSQKVMSRVKCTGPSQGLIDVQLVFMPEMFLVLTSHRTYQHLHPCFQRNFYALQTSAGGTEVDNLIRWLIEQKGLPAQRADCVGVNADGTWSFFTNTDVREGEVRRMQWHTARKGEGLPLS